MTINENQHILNADKANKKYKTILFDFDGTLVDTIPQIVESFQHVYMTLKGHYGNEDFILSNIGKPLEKSFDEFPLDLHERAVEIYREHNKKNLQKGVAIFFGINEMLEQLRLHGVVLGVVTSKRYNSAKMTAQQFEIFDYFDVFITRDDTKKHKPYPDPIFKALSDLKDKGFDEAFLNTSSVLFVGDSIHDLDCAKNAGVDVAIVNWTQMKREEILKAAPDFWIYKALELIELV